MPVKHCRHMKEDGISCHSPALRGESYCHFHLRYKGHRLRTWRGRRSGGLWALHLPPPDDLPSIQISLWKVMQALLDDRIGVEDSGKVLRGLELAAAKLRGSGPRGREFPPPEILTEDWDED